MNTLYVSDLDGTLLGDDAVLSSFTEASLRRLLADGLPFTVASARSVVSMQNLLRGLPLRLPVIEFNGAFLSDLFTGRHEVVNALEPSAADSIYEQVLAQGLAPFVSSFNGTEDRVHYNAVINDGMHWYLNDRLIHKDRRWQGPSDDLSASLREQVVCFTVIAEEKTLLELQFEISATHGNKVETHLFENSYSPGWHWLTVHDHKATKDQAIQTLVDGCGLCGSEIVVFGDQVNDLKMFQFAHRAIAVENAVDELKSHADFVIGLNGDDSVVKFIQTDWTQKRQSVRSSGKSIKCSDSMNIPIHGISHITFSVSDLEKSIAFYQSVFDAELLVKAERMAYLMVGGLWLALNVQEDISRQETRKSYTHIAFSLNIADFEKMEQRLTHLGVPLGPGRKREEGEGKSLYFFDPDEHLLEFHAGDLSTRLQAYLNTGDTLS